MSCEERVILSTYSKKEQLEIHELLGMIKPDCSKKERAVWYQWLIEERLEESE